MTSNRKLLFDQFLLVSFKEDKNGAGGIIPFVKDVYPPDQVDPNIPLFCFPEEIDNKAFMNQAYTPSKSSESFSFVLTDREGNQQFGFTRRIVTTVPSLGRIPESLCIISKHAWFSTFIAILEILEVRYRVSIEEIHNFLAAALLSAIPAPGDNFTVYIYNNPFISAAATPTTNINTNTITSTSTSSSSTSTSTPSTPTPTTRDRSLSTPNLSTTTNNSNDDKGSSSSPIQPLPVSYQLKRPLATDKSSLHDGTLLPLIESLTSQKILSLFISLLFERRIIIYSENISRVSKFVNAAVSMIDPFVWQHIFIPILPRSLLDYVTAPMPFIIGIHSSLFPLIRKKPLSEIIYVDLDKDHVLPLPEDLALFPQQLLQPLKACLDQQITDFKKNKHYDNKIIVDTFRKLFVIIMGTYRRFFMKDLDKKKSIFDKLSFIDSQLITPTKFFNVFCSSQMFERFIAEREEYFFKGITPPGIFEKEVILYDLKHPVTASINNTLKSKEKEKEKEREKERLEKERAKAMAKANAYKTVLDPKRLSVINPPKSNGSVDRSFLSSLIGNNNNNNNNNNSGNANANGNSLTVTNNNSNAQSTSPSLSRASPSLPRSTTLGSIASKAQTMTALEVGSLPPLNDVQLPIPPHIQQQQQQQKLQQQDGNGSGSGASLPKPKSHTNLASLASNIVHNAASITKSTSASFTLGHGQSLLPPNPTLHINQQPLQSTPQPQQLTVNSNSTGSSHSRTLSDVGQILLSVTKKSTQILGSAAQPQTPKETQPTTPIVQITQTHPNSSIRLGIGSKSLPFTLIHQKFSPNDPTRMSVEEIFNLFYPGQKPSINNNSNIAAAGAVANPPVTSTSGIHKSPSFEKNLFKIPELPGNISIPLSINTKNKNPTAGATSNNSFSTQASGSHGSINNHISGSNSGIQLTVSAPANPTIISSSYAVSDKSTLPPPPVSAHSILHRRTHQRSVSVSTSTPSSRNLTNSLDPNIISIQPPPQTTFKQIPINNHLVVQQQQKERELLEKEKEQLILQQQQIQQQPQQQQQLQVPTQTSLVLSSSSVPNHLPLVNQPSQPSQPPQPQPVEPPVEQHLPPLTNNTVQLPIPVVDHNPLPPLNTAAAVVAPTTMGVDPNHSGSLLHRSGSTPMMHRTTSSSNFFDNNPLSTNIETSPAVALASSSASSNFFNECSSLGVPSSLPQIVGSTTHSTATSSACGTVLSNTSSLNSSFGSFTSAVLNSSNILSASGMMMPPPSSLVSAAQLPLAGQPPQPQPPQPTSSLPINHSNASSFSSNPTNNNNNTTASSNNNVLPPLITSSTAGLVPPPPSIPNSNHFFDQSPLSHSSFVDFGPPAPSLPGLTNNNSTYLTSTPPPTAYNVPQQQQPPQQPISQQEGVEIDEFELYLKNQKKL